MTAKQMKRCRQRLEEFLREMLSPVGRSERRHWGAVYMRGLLLDGERKSVGAMALRLPEANEQSLQQFLSQSPWAWEPVWEHLAQKLSRAFPLTAWVLDDTSFPQTRAALGGCATSVLRRPGQKGELPGGGQPASDRFTGP